MNILVQGKTVLLLAVQTQYCSSALKLKKQNKNYCCSLVDRTVVHLYSREDSTHTNNQIYTSTSTSWAAYCCPFFAISQFAAQFFGGFSLKIGNWRGCSRALSSILVVRKNKFEEKPQRIYLLQCCKPSEHPPGMRSTVCGLEEKVAVVSHIQRIIYLY